ncbi:GIY-YIG nuclease family protein [Streptomyces sp. NPDC032198]|uniref:GIY-YIG nuclease family protein n=1 Tax=Streptomyces sp. NPDC032198 TaxID=3155127 RepID=UPI00341131C5
MARQLGLGGGSSHRAEFRLSITQALKDQLAEALRGLQPTPLTKLALEQLERRGGIYQLYLDGKFVYVGKADKNLPGRIAKHRRKISGRIGISLSRMSFTCLYVDEDFPAVAPERLLIAKYREQGEIPWNTNGFGNNDPGRRRDDTINPANHFDVCYPVDLERIAEGVTPGEISLRKLLADLKKCLPYNFRYAVTSLGEMGDRVVHVPGGGLTADQLFSLVASAIDEEWQIVVLHGYVIMYPDVMRQYPSARRYYRDGAQFDVTPEVDDVALEIAEETESDDDS